MKTFLKAMGITIQNKQAWLNLIWLMIWCGLCYFKCLAFEILNLFNLEVNNFYYSIAIIIKTMSKAKPKDKKG